jgi:predicted alpha/beta-fold hydrolase
MELHHNVESSLARTLAALDEVLDKRRRGMHIMELNGYVSTVTLGLRRPPADGITAHEELVTLPDGGTVRLVWRRAGWPGCMRSPQGVVLILPGLNNSSRWPAVQQTAVAFCARGFDTAVLDYRGVAGLKLTSAKIGCLDAWRDLPAVLRVVAGATHPEAPIFAIGFSMGGSILLKHLCAEPGTPIRAAVTVSAPLRLSEHMRRLETGLEWRLVNLAIAAIKKVEILGLHGRDHPALRQVDWRQMVLATRLREIEAAGVCPLHGYATPEDYCEPAGGSRTAGLAAGRRVGCSRVRAPPRDRRRLPGAARGGARAVALRARARRPGHPRRARARSGARAARDRGHAGRLRRHAARRPPGLCGRLGHLVAGRAVVGGRAGGRLPRAPRRRQAGPCAVETIAGLSFYLTAVSP